MRKGIPMSGNHLNQELVITSGALEAMIVDYQCIFPSLARTASSLPHADHLHQCQGKNAGFVFL